MLFLYVEGARDRLEKGMIKYSWVMEIFYILFWMMSYTDVKIHCFEHSISVHIHYCLLQLKNIYVLSSITPFLHGQKRTLRLWEDR